jgi:DNA-binding NtrC family response regulator
LIETPLTKSTFKSFINKINNIIRQQIVLSTNLDTNKNGGNYTLTGEVDAIKQINEFINFLAKTPNVICLLRCENGTEKNLVIHLIHQKGKTNKGPLKIINCNLYSEEQLLSEIFGVEYNDDKMNQNKRGLLELTDSGTLVLENIENISEELQYRIQAYLEHHTFRRIGAKYELKVNTRIIATTTHDLERYINFSSFSRELYFRFKAFEITIPPLRRRKSDILPLSNHFIQYYNQKFGHKVLGLTPEAEQMFIHYNWPGNVEELKLIIKRAVLLTKEGHISLSVLPIDMGQHKMTDFESEFLGNCSLRDIERLHIERVLLRTKGNKSKAAELLNISRTTLREKMRLFNLPH